MTTLAELRDQAPFGTNFTTLSADPAAPEGTFPVATMINDKFTAFLFSGPAGSPEAVLLGRVESGKDALVSFRGGGLADGERVPGVEIDWDFAFAALVS